MLRRLLPRRISPLRRPRTAAPGYAMPLAVGASGVLLLMSLTLHGMAMQERLQVGARERQQREEDLLVSAAHQLLAALNASTAAYWPFLWRSGSSREQLAPPLRRWRPSKMPR